MRYVLAAMVLVGGLLLPTAHGQDAGDVAKLIEQLGSDDAAVRKKAMTKLEEVGEPALEALQKAAKDHPDADVRLRAQLVARAVQAGPYEELKVITGQPAGYWLNRVAFTPDGKQVVAGGGAVIWYDPEQGKELRRVMERQFARRGLVLSADGKLFLTGHQTDTVVRLAEAESGKEVQTFPGHEGGVYDVALSPDGTRAAVAGRDNKVRGWDVKTGKELWKPQGLFPPDLCLSFSSDGKRLASGCHGEPDMCRVRLWDAEAGKELLTMKGHTKNVTAVRFLPDGKSLLSASLDGTLRLWDVETGKELKKLEHAGGVNDVAVSADGKRALSAGWEDRTVRLWDLATGKELHRFEGHTIRVLSVAFSPDGKRAASSDANCTVRVWRLAK